MIKKLLIANRGEIVSRIIKACRDLGIETVAVYSEPDRNALHVRNADAAVCIGPGPALESYLVIELYGDLPEYDPPGGVMSQLGGGDTETLQRILSNLQKAGVDDRIEGVVLKVSASA